jgi:Type II secretory pathway, prepilin signal peptidase PulO and related peptidases
VQISWRYPFVEILTGLLFYLTAFYTFGIEINPARLLLNLVFVGGVIALALIDLDTFRLPDVLTLPLLGFGLLGAFFIPGSPTGMESLLSALGAGGVFWVLVRVYPKGMGLGDVKLIAAMGAFLGFPSIFLALFIGSFFGAVFGVFSLLIGRRKFKQQIPFGPYLALGAIVTLFWQTQIFNWYWTLVR